MANEKEMVTVLEIQTGKTITTLNEAREAVRSLRKEVAETEITDEKYTETTKRLAAAQEALTQLTRQTTAAQAENWEGVDLATKSYNELTKQMKALNAEWRATTDEVQRQQLGRQILAINTRLKELDASTGNFQRNVGDYANQMKAGMEAFTKAAGNAIPGLNNLKAVADGFARNPMIAALGLLVQLFTNLVARMKETKEGQQTINHLMEVLNAILSPLRDLIDAIVESVNDLFDRVADDIDDTTESVASLGSQVSAFFNTIWRPISTAIQGNLIRIGGYLRSIGAFIRGDFKKANVEWAQAEAKALVYFATEGQKALELQKNYDEALERIEKRRRERARRRQQDNKKEAQEVQQIFVDVASVFERSDAARQRLFDNLKKENPWDQVKKDIKEVQELIPELTEEERADMEEEDRYLQGLVERAAKRKEIMAEFTKASASLLGDVADALEASEDTASRHAGTIKALRAAETIINTISGAMGAFMGITKDTGGWGIALAAVQAASIMATGYANVRKILATDTSKNASTSSVSTTSSVPAVSAPTVDYTPQTVTSATGAAEVERLNAGRGDQRVYVVYSDIAQAGRQVAVQQAESSFK